MFIPISGIGWERGNTDPSMARSGSWFGVGSLVVFRFLFFVLFCFVLILLFSNGTPEGITGRLKCGRREAPEKSAAQGREVIFLPWGPEREINKQMNK